ncbi:MAG: hypothetical protein KKB20_06980, partial [Proteobacteria bacterium]|nr:hypothetical protein [Pseudomonadota bacterium]
MPSCPNRLQAGKGRFFIIDPIGTVLVCCLLLGLLAGGPSALALEPLRLDPQRDRYDLGSHVEILEDPEGNLTLDQVESPPFSDRFVEHRDPRLSLGYSRAAFWLRFRLDIPNESGTWLLEVGKPALAQVDLYTPRILKDASTGREMRERIHTGTDGPSSLGAVLYRTPLLELPCCFDSTNYFHLRLKSDLALNMSLVVWSARGLIGETLFDFLAFGIIYGVLMGMIFYNLILMFVFRDRVYFYYVAYMTSVLVWEWMMYGHVSAFRLLRPATHTLIWWVSLGASWLSASAFIRSFLDTRTNTPFMDRLITITQIMAALMCLTGLLGYERWANMLSNTLSLSLPPIGMFTAVLCLKRQYRPALYFLTAWAVLLVGLTLYGLGGVIIPRSPLTVYTFAVG